MASLAQIHENLAANTDITASLQALGTLLRDEHVRSDEALSQIIPYVLRPFAEDTNTLEALRVLVNFTADNDENRKYMTSRDAAAFWENYLGYLHTGPNQDILHRLVVLLSQFIHNVEDQQMAEYVNYLTTKGASEALLAFIETIDVDELSLSFELLAELCTRNISAEKLVGIAEMCTDALTLDDEEGDEILHFASQVIFNATNVEDYHGGREVIGKIYTLLPNIPGAYKNVARTKRTLFSSCGNISSSPSYNNWKDVEKSVGVIMQNNDAYVTAAAAISLGNCVNSKAAQEELLAQISVFAPVLDVVQQIMQCPFGDVVLYQALHFFNNTMTLAIAAQILNDEPHLRRITKVVVDNGKYYKEVGAIFFKFLRKLMSLGLVANQVRPMEELHEVWTILEGSDSSVEIHLLLLQAVIAHNTELPSGSKALLATLLSSTESVDVQVLFEKFKTMAMLFQKFDGLSLEKLYTRDFETEFTAPLARFLSQLREALQNAEQNAQSAAVANNAKYMAAAVINAMKTVTSSDTIEEITKECNGIIRL